MIDKPGLLSVIHHVLDSVIAILTFRNNQRHNADNAIHESETTRQTIKAILNSMSFVMMFFLSTVVFSVRLLTST